MKTRSDFSLPNFLEPMQAKLVDSMRPGDWIYEIKFDGYRALALRGGNETRILSRNQKDLGKKFSDDSGIDRQARRTSSTLEFYWRMPSVATGKSASTQAGFMYGCFLIAADNTPCIACCRDACIALFIGEDLT
jgi:hypothetical protein